MPIKVKWIKVDLSKPKKELPAPLNKCDYGCFWIIHDGEVNVSHFLGDRFNIWGNERITYFAEIDKPDPPV